MNDQKHFRPAPSPADTIELHFTLPFHGHSSPMWIYDVDTLAFLDANDAAVALYGYTREEFLALKITEIRPTEDYALFFAWLSQPPVDMRLPGDWRHKRKNGTLINVEVSSYPLTYNGRSARLVEIRDVTEQTHTAESLRESELRLRSLLDTFPYLVWIKDTEGRFLSVNQPFVDAFNQKSIKDVIGKTDLDITNRELAEKYIADDKKVIANGTRILVEEEIIANDSRKWFETHKSPMFDQNGIVLGSAGFARDITERKNYEDALRKSEEKFRRVFYTSPDAISVNRIADGMYISINRGFTQISGYTEEEIIGRTSFEIQIWENLEDRKKLVEGLKKSGSVENLEARFRAKNGSTIIGLLSAAVIDINGEPCIIIITRDISEMKKTEQLLRDTQRRESLGVLSSGIAHDFNNLLGIMLGNISLAQSHLPPAHAAMNNIEKALTAMERAAELTKQMLAYSGKGKFQIRTIDLVAVVKEHASLFDVSLPKNVKLETRLSAEPVYINGDPGQIEQIIMNLIINGGDAIGEAQGVVSVTLETCVMNANELAPYGRIANTVLPSGAYACLEVRDNGIGMSRETMRKIFDPFFTTKFTGRGLGLSAVLGILQGHKGGLIVDSTEGKGTMFRLILPLCDAPDSCNQPSSEEIAPPALATTTILVIDDEADIAEMAQEILETAEYQVLVSLNPVEGVALFAREWSRIGLVLLDLTMPEMSGKEVVEKLQAILPDVKIIISSGYTQEEVAKRIGSLKVSAFIHKPYRLNALLSVVENVLR